MSMSHHKAGCCLQSSSNADYYPVRAGFLASVYAKATVQPSNKEENERQITGPCDPCRRRTHKEDSIGRGKEKEAGTNARGLSGHPWGIANDFTSIRLPAIFWKNRVSPPLEHVQVREHLAETMRENIAPSKHRDPVMIA